jgi:hypothetical protein
MTKAEGLGLTVFFLYSSYPLTFLIFDIWNTQDYSNNIYSNRQYSIGDAFAILWCMLAAVWGAGRLIFQVKSSRQAREELSELYEVIKSRIASPKQTIG